MKHLKESYETIKYNWEKLVAGQPVNREQLSPLVYESWRRCMMAGVDPYALDKALFLTQEEVTRFSSIAFEEMEEMKEDMIMALKEIAGEMELSFLLFDHRGKIKKVLATAGKMEYVVPRDISENLIGTNSICLALKHNTPVQIFGPEHFNQELHQYNCSAAPIHDSNGKVIGAINIGSHIKQSQTLETLGFVISIAKLIENSIHINRTLAELTVSNIAKLKDTGAAYEFDDIIGDNEIMKKVKLLARKAAKTSSPILIHGESGTGKELFAQAIHNESCRRNMPFVAINCGAIPTELIESELFGYEPGAFTGASKGTKLGKIEAASGGTFFMDEIESMPLNMQVKLLRALSANKITRIGGVKDIPIDIRIIAATKKDLLSEVEQGNFREDLYFRISTIPIKIPPLRDRKDDIPLLADNYINYFLSFTNQRKLRVEPEFIEALTYYYWRGNVRELRNVIERAVMLGDDTKLSLNNLPPKIIEAYMYKTLKEKMHIRFDEIKKNRNTLKAGEEIIIEMVLNEEEWNLTKSAERLGISRPTLYKKIGEYPKLKKRKDNLQLS